MPTNSLIDALRQHRLLDLAQLNELNAVSFPDPKALAKELIRRNWLTPYQANQLLNGKGQELILGSYILLERLGEGGMGQVFKARHRNLGRIAAIKLIRKDRLDNPTAIKRFQREVRAASALAHPNIVLVYDADEIAGTHLMVMEYIEGAIDLAKLVKKNGPPPVERACEYIRQAALGLQHAYERGMVHRDIKPANLLLTAGGKTVKVLDMGLARLDQPADEDDDKSSTMTQEGAVMGTPDYIAPEQALDTHTVDIRADLYSLGRTFYYLLVGREPFPGGTLLQKLNKHQNEQPLAIEKLRPEVPPAVAKVVRKLMAKRPADRYQTPAEAASALAAVNQSLTAIAATPLANLATEATVAWNPAAASPAVPNSGGSLSSALDYIAKRSDTVAFVPEGTPKKPKSRRWLIVALGTGVLALLGLAILVLLIPRGGNQAKKDEGPIDGPKKLVKNGDGPIDGKVVDKKELAKGKTPAPPAWSLDFDGNARVNLPALALNVNEPLTVEIWVTPRAQSSEIDPTVFEVGWIRQTINLGFKKWQTGLPQDDPKHKETYRLFWSDQEYSPGKRTHLAAVWTGKGIHFYVNGKYQNDHDNVLVGNAPDRLSFMGVDFQGQIHQFRVSRAQRYKGLSTSIGERFENDDETLILYRFGEGEGEKLTDSSGKGHHGKIVGAKWVKMDESSPSATPTIDLLPLIDPAKDKVHGDWKFNEKGELVSDKAVTARIRIPYQPPTEYDLLVNFTNLSAPNGVSYTLVGGGRQFRVEFGAYGNSRSFFEMVDGNIGKENRTAKVKAAWLTTGKRHESRVEVRKNSARAYLDGALVTELLETDFKNVDIPPWWDMKEQGVLGLGSFESPTAFHKVQVVEISGPGTFTRPDDPAAKKAAELRKIARPPLAVAPFDAKKAQEYQQLWANDLGRPVEETNSVRMKLRLIPPGDGVAKAFYLGKYEVTQGEWELVMGYNPSGFGPNNAKVAAMDTSKFPVDTVGWYDSVEYCNKLSEREGLKPYYELTVTMRSGKDGKLIDEAEVKILGGSGYHIPTDAEWEHGCRAGTKTKYHCGDKDEELLEYAWFDKNSDGRTHTVGEKKPNAFGLYDMHGNVREWNEEMLTNAIGAPERVTRGGNWSHTASHCAVSSRHRLHPAYRHYYFGSGLRLARVAAGFASAAIPPLDPAWEKAVAAMKPEQQIEAVKAELMKRNPGFDGRIVSHKIDKAGVVTELRFFTDNITDIAPVRALTRLRSLTVDGSGNRRARNGKLADLSPLKDLTLAYFHCDGTQVSDLGPLKGMKLENLSFAATDVSDLLPLKDMALRVLSCVPTKVSDLSPLKGMPLKDLYCDPDIAGRNGETLRSIPTLETINGQPKEAFWKEVDAKKAGTGP